MDPIRIYQHYLDSARRELEEMERELRFINHNRRSFCDHCLCTRIVEMGLGNPGRNLNVMTCLMTRDHQCVEARTAANGNLNLTASASPRLASAPPRLASAPRGPPPQWAQMAALPALRHRSTEQPRRWTSRWTPWFRASDLLKVASSALIMSTFVSSAKLQLHFTTPFYDHHISIDFILTSVWSKKKYKYKYSASVILLIAEMLKLEKTMNWLWYPSFLVWLNKLCFSNKNGARKLELNYCYQMVSTRGHQPIMGET